MSTIAGYTSQQSLYQMFDTLYIIPYSNVYIESTKKVEKIKIVTFRMLDPDKSQNDI